jgi:hypothetical protein
MSARAAAGDCKDPADREVDLDHRHEINHAEGDDADERGLPQDGLDEPKLKNSGCGIPMARIMSTKTMTSPVSSDQRQRRRGSSGATAPAFESLVSFDALMTAHTRSILSVLHDQAADEHPRIVCSFTQNQRARRSAPISSGSSSPARDR